MSKHTHSKAKSKGTAGESAVKTYKGWTHVPESAFPHLYMKLLRSGIRLRGDAMFLLGLMISDSINRRIGAEYPAQAVYEQEEFPLLDSPEAVRRAIRLIEGAGLVAYDEDSDIVSIPDSTYALIEVAR